MDLNILGECYNANEDSELMRSGVAPSRSAFHGQDSAMGHGVISPPSAKGESPIAAYLRSEPNSAAREGLHVITEDTNETMASLMLSHNFYGRDSQRTLKESQKRKSQPVDREEASARIDEELYEEEEEETKDPEDEPLDEEYQR